MKIFTGRVVKNKMKQTATVAVEHFVVHPIYQKRIRRMKIYQVHDESGAAVGDTVKFTACRPYSKTKKWKIISTPDSLNPISVEKDAKTKAAVKKGK